MAKFNVREAEHNKLFAIVGEHQGRHCQPIGVSVTTYPAAEKCGAVVMRSVPRER